MGGNRFSDERRPRHALLVAIVLAHLLAIALLMTWQVAEPVAERGGTVITLSSFAPPAPPRQPPAPRPLVKPVLSLPVPEQAVTNPATQPSAPAVGVPGECALVADTQAAITRDAAAMAELASLPSELRTEADAVMVWNGEWVDLAAPQIPSGSAVAVVPGGTAGALSELRRVIRGVVGAASPSCRDGPVAGPVFIAIPEPGRTTMLVIGSGAWSWSNLLIPIAPCVATVFFGSCPPDPAVPLSPNYLNRLPKVSDAVQLFLSPARL